MGDRKTTLYLALLCIVLMVWGSVLDGKRKHVREVLEAENAELLTLVDETQANYEEANTKQAQLARKLESLKKELAALKVRNDELQKLNEELKAQLEEAISLRKEAEKKAQEAARSNTQAAQASPSAEDNARIKELERKLNSLIRERDEARYAWRRDSEDRFSSSLALTDLESQLRFCREQVRGLKEDSLELRDLKSRVKELERELASRTQELWNTRLTLSADLDTCTRQLMKASAEVAAPPPPPEPPCKMKMMKKEEKPASGEQKPCEKKCMKNKGKECKCDCPRMKQMEAKLQACSSRLEAMEKELNDSNARHLEEMAQLKKALAGKIAPPAPEVEKPAPVDIPQEIKNRDAEIERLKAEIGKKEQELAQYKRNTEALLQQIRQQRAEIKKLKAGKQGT